MTIRTVQIHKRRRRSVYERCVVTIEVSDADALAVRAYPGPPEDEDFADVANTAGITPPACDWIAEQAEEFIEDLDCELIEIDPSVESTPPVIAKPA